MHLHWKEYKLKNGKRSLRAELVKSYRDKTTGQPRNKVVGYLGSIHEAHLKYALVRQYFWWQIECKLSRLILSEVDREKIIEAIKERVPFEIVK